MTTRTLKQSITFKASPHALYEALMDAKQHSAFTGDAATISRKVGGAFSTFGGYATGTNVQLVPDRKIVQTWRANDWPAGTTSTVTFAFTKVRGGTKLTLTHTAIPADFFDDIKTGWIEYYWIPLGTFLQERSAQSTPRSTGRHKQR